MADLIERTKPTGEAVSAEWTPVLRGEILEEVLTGRARRMPFGRRPWPVAVAASLIVTLMLAVPVAFPGWFIQTAAAEELCKVARLAGEQPSLEWADGQFLRVQFTEMQTGDPGLGAGTGTRRVTHDAYYTTDGWTWSARTVNGRVERYIFPPSWGWMRPDYAAGMPTEPHALDAFLRARVLGSSSQDEAVFVAIGDMLRQEAAPPQVRAAAIGVLGLNPKVTVEHTTDPQGRTALKTTFIDEGTRPGMRQYLYLAPDTGALLASGNEGRAPTVTSGTSTVPQGPADAWTEFRYESVIANREVVDALPAELAHALGTEKVGKEITNGQTQPIANNPGPDPAPVPQPSYTPPPKR